MLRGPQRTSSFSTTGERRARFCAGGNTFSAFQGTLTICIGKFKKFEDTPDSATHSFPLNTSSTTSKNIPLVCLEICRNNAPQYFRAELYKISIKHTENYNESHFNSFYFGSGYQAPRTGTATLHLFALLSRVVQPLLRTWKSTIFMTIRKKKIMQTTYSISISSFGR